MGFRLNRQDVVFGLLALMLVGLCVRLGQMTSLRAVPGASAIDLPAKIEKAKLGTRIEIPIAARPGTILARGRNDSVVMAASRQVPSCFVDPKLLSYQQLAEVADELADVFELDPGQLYTTLASRRNRRFVWLAREVSESQKNALDAWKKRVWAACKEQCKTMAKDQALKHRKYVRNKIRSVGVQYEWRREYPNGDLAGTVLGYFNKNNESGGGLHSMVSQYLLPKQGRAVLRGTASRQAIGLLADESKKPQDGKNVYTSIDINIQRFLQDAVSKSCDKYGAKWGTGIVMNPWTGDVLAMCSCPTYDPNKYTELTRDQMDHMLNRTICSPYEPGSIFKPLIAASAVNDGKVNWQTKIFCENGAYFPPRGGRITDHGHRYGRMTVEYGIVKSINTLMAKLGVMYGNRWLHDTVYKWGFGQKTGIGLPGETKGIVRPLRKWDTYSTPRVPFGQELAASSLQLVRAFCALANGGILMKPRLVQKITDANGQLVQKIPPCPIRRVVSPETAYGALEAMRKVVTEGTGKKSRIKNYTSWGKTGTAQIPGINGYTEGAYTGSFVGGAPFSRPAVVCLISIYWPDRNKGYYGGTVAAPYVKDVLEKTLTYLQITPDRSQGR